MSTADAIRLKSPVHLGGFVKHEIIEPHGLSVTKAARALGITRPALSGLLNERASLSSEMALRIEKAFGVSMDTLSACRPATTSPKRESRKARSTSIVSGAPAAELGLSDAATFHKEGVPHGLTAIA